MTSTRNQHPEKYLIFRGIWNFIPGVNHDCIDTANIGTPFNIGDVIIGSDGNSYICISDNASYASWYKFTGGVFNPMATDLNGGGFTINNIVQLTVAPTNGNGSGRLVIGNGLGPALLVFNNAQIPLSDQNDGQTVWCDNSAGHVLKMSTGGG